MNKKGCLILALSTALISSSFASNIFKFEEKLKEYATHQTGEVKEKSVVKYMDFSGTWHGTCSNREGYDGEIDLTIRQNKSDSITVDGIRLIIDNLSTTGMVEDSNANTVYMLPKWDKEGQLVIRVIGEYYSKKFPPKRLNYLGGRVVFSLKDNKLITKEELMYYPDTDSSLPYGEDSFQECTLEKVTRPGS